MQPVDLTTLSAVRAELRSHWLPARAEQVYQWDPYRISLGLRTLKGRDWLTISWHPQAARICIAPAPPRTPDTFTFSDQLRHQLNGLALVEIETIAPWERVLDLQFSRRPGEVPVWHLYVEVMGKFSNVILADRQQQIVTAAHQVSPEQSSVRPVQTGKIYEPPPPLKGKSPSLAEPFSQWQEQVSLVPGKLERQLLKVYRGLSPTLVRRMCRVAGIAPDRSTADLSPSQWEDLFARWQEWLHILDGGEFRPGWTVEGYDVLGWEVTEPVENVQTLLANYYGEARNQQTFQQLQHQLKQKVASAIAKAQTKAERFRERLDRADEADRQRQQADLLMAYLSQWEPGMKQISLSDFETGEPVIIPLNPEKNAVQNAQALYKQHQKLKRSRGAIEPLLQEVEAEINYLEQVQAALEQLDTYRSREDLQSLAEIRDELIQQDYLPSPKERRPVDADESQPLRYRTPSGFELLVGRNNRQNDRLSFRTAVEYDLWFHTQEIPGSHVLLRLEPGAVADDSDLQFAADVAAYHSRARQSDRVPVVYTQPKYVFKPKGAKPGMAIYQNERVIWGQPQQANNYQNGSKATQKIENS